MPRPLTTLLPHRSSESDGHYMQAPAGTSDRSHRPWQPDDVSATLVPARAAARAEGGPASADCVCVVGPGWRFTSGISYYTCSLANAFAQDRRVIVIQMRRLLPRWLYPGRRRVGQPRARMSYDDTVEIFDGVDWWWGPSMIRALRYLYARRPAIVVLQWWTATVLHTYLLLAIVGRLLGSRVVIELHEMQDSGEERLGAVRWYGRAGLRVLLRNCQGCVAHSAADRQALLERYRLRHLSVTVVPHGPFTQYAAMADRADQQGDPFRLVTSAPRPAVTNLLFFGTIRPYKGVEDLIRAFNSLKPAEAANLWLTVVGETWEGCTEPARLIECSPYRDRIAFVNDYVPDEIVGAAFRHADVVVLPYRRSSSSGPLHVTMSSGLPVVVTQVGGLPEAAAGYDGAIFVPPGDVKGLVDGIRRAVRLSGISFADPRNWDDSVSAILAAAGSRNSTPMASAE
jgi:glycosyltransferase involved in cell wall biosynthesis